MNKKKNINKQILKKLYRDFVSVYKFDIFLAFILLIFVSLTASTYPYLIQKIFDGLIDKNENWMFIPVFIAILAVVRGITMYLQIKQVAKISLKIGRDIQQKLSNHILFSDVEIITKISSGNHISRVMNDVHLIREGVEKSINNLIKDLLTIIFLLCYLLWLDWVLSLFVILIYPLALKPIITIGKKQRYFAKSLQEHLEGLTSFLSEIFRSVSMIKSYSLEKKESNRINSSLNSLFEKMYNLVKGRAKILPILEVLGGMAVAIVIYVASFRVMSGDLTAGSVIGFVTALLMLAQPARALGTFNTVAQEGLSALERIFRQLDIEPKIEGKISEKDLKLNLSIGPRIEFDNVSFLHLKDEMILKKISFVVESCEKLAVIGPSGSGKTTILNLISRFFDPTSGSILINNIELPQYKLSSLRQMVSLVSQDIIIYNDTFYNNILLGDLNASNKNVINASKKAKIHDYITSLPDGYNTIIGEGGNTLSGGQKQRISIARAFLKNSPILLLDEITSSLDKMTSKSVQNAFIELSQNKTCITVTHKIDDLKIFDKAIIIDNGKLKDEGNHKKLLNTSKIYRNLVQS